MVAAAALCQMKANKVYVQPEKPAGLRPQLPLVRAAGRDEEDPQPQARTLISSHVHREPVAATPKPQAPVNLSDWDSSTYRFPFLDAFLLFFSMLGTIISYFKYMAVTIGDNDVSATWAALVLYILTGVTILT